jgi:hypothetical protein
MIHCTRVSGLGLPIRMVVLCRMFESQYSSLGDEDEAYNNKASALLALPW